MSRTALFLVSGIACALVGGSVSVWGLTRAQPPQAAQVTLVPAKQSRGSPADTRQLQDCAKVSDGGLRTAQACPPGTCPCRAGGCSAQCC
jgi:hypothetical protein